MATITGSSGADTLDTNLEKDDEIYGLTGNDLYRYYLLGWNDLIHDTGGDDTIQFSGAIDYTKVSIVKYGDDLVIDLQDSGSIVVEDHYLSSANMIENLNFLSGLNIDLSDANLFVTERNSVVSNYAYFEAQGTTSADLMFVGAGEDVAMDSSDPDGWENGTTGEGEEGDDIIISNYALYIWADEGNDTVYGHAKTIWLGEGDDTFYGEVTNGIYDYSVYGGEGSDVLYGTADSDSFWGDKDNGYGGTLTSQGNDVLYGYGGNDTLRGNEGDDELYGGDGDDSIVGGDGDDYMEGNDGDDYITAGNGTDVAYGGEGNDTIRAGTTNGIVNSGDKIFYGGDGDDFLYGGDGDDLIQGETGNDTIDTRYGSDIVYGGTGDDYITIHVQEDEIMTVSGGIGDDIFYNGFLDPSGVDVVGSTDIEDTSGNDLYIYTYRATSIFYDIGTNTITDKLGNNDTLLFRSGNISDLNFFVSGNDLYITFDNSIGSIVIHDHFTLDGNIENLEFGEWDIPTQTKTVYTNHGLVEVLTPNNDTYTATSSTSAIGSDRNIVDALAGDDTIYLGAGDDIVYGREGDDTLYGEAGDDQFVGGAGADDIDGGIGSDTVSYTELTTAVTINLSNGTASGGDANGDTFTSIENVITTNENDTIIGNSSDNTFEGRGGDDILSGGAGDDTFVYTVGDGEDTINETSGFDVLSILGGVVLGDLGFTVSGDDLDIFVFGETITITDFFVSDTIEEIWFDDSSTYDLDLLNFAPVLVKDNRTFTEDTSITIDVLANDSDPDGDTLTIDHLSNVDNGTAVINGDETITFTPDEDYFGTESFYYTVTDGNGHYTTQIVNLTILDDNDPTDNNVPPVLVKDNRTFNEDTPITINVLANDSDANGDTLTVTNLSNVDYGTAVINGDNTITFTPDDDYNGTESFYYTVSDGNGGSATQIVNLTITAVADTSADFEGTGENNTLTGTSSDESFAGLGGSDTITGGAGADDFIFTGATAFGGSDTITDFSTTDNDALDISDVLSGYDPLTDAITDFVQITDNGTDSTLAVDADGGADNFVAIAILSGVTGLTDEAVLETAGHLITA